MLEEHRSSADFALGTGLFMGLALAEQLRLGDDVTEENDPLAATLAKMEYPRDDEDGEITWDAEDQEEEPEEETPWAEDEEETKSLFDVSNSAEEPKGADITPEQKAEAERRAEERRKKFSDTWGKFLSDHGISLD